MSRVGPLSCEFGACCRTLFILKRWVAKTGGVPRPARRFDPYEERRPMSTVVATEFPVRMYIDGKWCDARAGTTLAVINPADESVLAEVAYGGKEDAQRAIAAAAQAFPEWRAASVYDRA